MLSPLSANGMFVTATFAILQRINAHYIGNQALYTAAGVRRCGIQPVGAGVPNLLRNTPIPSTSSSTTSPGLSNLPSSNPHPHPTVPEPMSSPACRPSPLEL